MNSSDGPCAVGSSRLDAGDGAPRMTMVVLVVSDPLHACDPDGDTTLGLMAAALERGNRVWHTTAAGVELVGGTVRARARPVSRRGPDGRDAPVLVESGHESLLALADTDAVVVRPDPPVDAEYLAMTLLLELARNETVIVNDPRGLREANEKLYACRFPDLMPETIVSADPATLLGFVEEHRAAVLKPLDGHGGRDVRLLVAGAPGTSDAIDGSTRGGRRAVMAQRFLPGVVDGDRRILLVDGAPLGVIRRRPPPGEFRANIGLGALVDVVDLDDRDRRVVDGLARSLRADGLWFVGIDVIDGCLSEVNVTSPTGLRQLTRLGGGRPDLEVIDRLQELVAAVGR